MADSCGHGLDHARKVALDAGALMIIEAGAAGCDPPFARRRTLLVQAAGLLHDIRRKDRGHAEKGAADARRLLEGKPVSAEEAEDICMAIRNHEAFRDPVPIRSPEGRRLSDCLYDADKFRWGPDNFTDTVWEMLRCRNPSLAQFMAHYPAGMEGVGRIKDTFRTATGRRYGPQFIDIGMAIGAELQAVIHREFSRFL